MKHERPKRIKVGSCHRTIISILAVVVLLTLVVNACRPEWPYSNPPPSLQAQDLAGVWQERYWLDGTDTLILRADGAFQQTFRSGSYVYQTPWQPWTLERFPDGRVRLHLQGARYYASGIDRAEQDATENRCVSGDVNCSLSAKPWPFYDPIGRLLVDMVGELILNVQVSARGELVLLHMTTSSDAGWVFLVLGLRAERFRRVAPP